MAFRFIASAEAINDAAGTTLDCSSSLAIVNGDLLVVACKHEGVAATFAWLPNVLILLTSLAFLTKRDDQCSTTAII